MVARATVAYLDARESVVRAALAKLETELRDIEAARAQLQSLVGLTAAPTQPHPARTAAKDLCGATIVAVLEAMRNPMACGAIFSSAQFRSTEIGYDRMQARIRELVADGVIVRTGERAGTRYCLPEPTEFDVVPLPGSGREGNSSVFGASLRIGRR